MNKYYALESPEASAPSRPEIFNVTRAISAYTFPGGVEKRQRKRPLESRGSAGDIEESKGQLRAPLIAAQNSAWSPASVE